jgi:hypothetical protein
MEELPAADTPRSQLDNPPEDNAAENEDGGEDAAQPDVNVVDEKDGEALEMALLGAVQRGGPLRRHFADAWLFDAALWRTVARFVVGDVWLSLECVKPSDLGDGRALQGCTAVAVASDGSVVVVDRPRNEALVLLPDLQVQRRFECGKSVEFVAITRQDELLVGHFGESAVSLHALSGQELWRVDGSEGACKFGNINGVCEMPDGNVLVADRGNNALHVYSRAGVFVRCVKLDPAVFQTPLTIAALPDGRVVMSDFAKQTVSILDLDGNAPPRTLLREAHEVYSIVPLRMRGRELLMVGSEGSAWLRAIDLEGRTMAALRHVDGAPFSPFGVAQLSPGRFLCAWKRGGASRLVVVRLRSL